MFLEKLYKQRFDSWLEKRLPRTRIASLNSRSVFTFPSRAGFGYIGVMLLLWLLATNFENNIIFALGALLGATLVVGIFHSFANLAGLNVQVKSIGAGFPGDMLRVDLELSQRAKRRRDDIRVSFPGVTPVRVGLEGDAVTVTLYVPAKRRGKRFLERLTIESSYPLGLIRVWTHILLSGYGIVYPNPIAGDPLGATDGDENSDGENQQGGSEDFDGLNPYRPGESTAHIAWKQFARGQGLHSKKFTDPICDPQWLDWNSYPGLDREARLSRLCHAVLESAKHAELFGLRLPGCDYPLGSGGGHRDQLLRALGLFESEGS